MTDDSIPGALLTPSQREFIRGEKDDLSDAAQRMTKKRIEERLENAIQEDIPIVAHSVDEKNVVDGMGFKPLVNGLQSQVVLIYNLADAAGLDPEKVIREGIGEAKASKTDKIVERLQKDPESVTLGELQTLKETGAIGPDEYSEAYRNALAPPEPGAVSAEEFGGILEEWQEEAEAEDE